MKTNAPVRVGLLILALGGSACMVKDKVSIEPYAVCASPTDAATCAESATCDATLAADPSVYLLWNGAYDASKSATGLYDNGLYLFMQFNNNMTSDSTNTTTGVVDSHDAFIRKYRLSFAADGYSIPDYTATVTDTNVPANGTATTVVPVIPKEMSATLQALLPADALTEVTVHVSAEGVLQNGGSFETGYFQVHAYVYNATFTGYSCTTSGDIAVGACPNVGQTSSVDCQTP